MSALIPIIFSILLKAPGLITAFRDAFRHTIPGITDAQIAAALAAITGQADDAFDREIAAAAADQAKG